MENRLNPGLYVKFIPPYSNKPKYIPVDSKNESILLRDFLIEMKCDASVVLVEIHEVIIFNEEGK